MNARCAFRRRAASCAKDVNVIFGLQKPLASIGVVSETEGWWAADVVAVDSSGIEAASPPKGSHVAFSDAGSAGWKYR